MGRGHHSGSQEALRPSAMPAMRLSSMALSAAEWRCGSMSTLADKVMADKVLCISICLHVGTGHEGRGRPRADEGSVVA